MTQLNPMILPMLRQMIRARAMLATAKDQATAAGEGTTATEIGAVLDDTGDGSAYFGIMRNWLAQCVDEYGQELVDQAIVTDEVGIAASGVLAELRAGD